MTMKSIRVTAGDWGGSYRAFDGHVAVRMFFRDITAGKIKLCQLSPLGTWQENAGEEIPFRIAPALMRAGKLTLAQAVATLNACDLDFSESQVKAMADADAWMLNVP